MPKPLIPILTAVALTASALLATPAIAQDARQASVYIQGINMGGDYPFASVNGGSGSSSGNTGTSDFRVVGPWAVSGTGGGEYREGP